jgi:hypothetical protein
MGAFQDCCRGSYTEENHQSGSGITPDTVFQFV